MFDEPGKDSREIIAAKVQQSHLAGGDDSDSSKVYTDHIGLNAGGFEMPAEGVMNLSTYRQRGYNIASINQKVGDPDRFHVHAGHALNKKSRTRFDAEKGIHLWDPESDGSDVPKPVRSLDLP
jgi:hypothetical protein